MGLVWRQQLRVFAPPQLVENNEVSAELMRLKARLSATERLTQTGGSEWDLRRDEWSFSEGWLSIHGSNGKSLSSADLINIAHPDDQAAVQKAFNAVRLHGQSYDLEHRIIRQDSGEIRWVKAHGELATDLQGSPLKVIGAIEDITERRQADEALRQSTQLLEASQSAARVGGWELDLETEALFWTAETYRIHDTTSDKYTPTVATALDFYLPESRRIISEKIAPAMEHGTGYDLVLEMETTKGRRIDVRATCEVTLVEGRPVKLTGIFQDISVGKLAEATLRENEKLYRQLFDEAPVGYHEIDATGCLVKVNNTELQLFGYTRDEMLGHTISEFMVNREASQAAIQAKFAGTLPVEGSFERRMRHKDGSILAILITDRLIRDSHGSITRIRSSLQNNTERKQAEEALRESEQKFRLLFENAPICVHEIDKKGQITMMNRVGLKMMEVSDAKAICGTSYLSAISTADQDRIDPLLQQALQGQSVEFEFESMNGRYCVSYVVPIADKRGDVQNLMGMTQDITERKAAELALRLSESQYSSLIHSVEGIVWEADAVTFSFTFVSDQAERLLVLLR